MYKETKFEDLLGKTLVEITGLERGNSYVVFKTSDGEEYIIQHYQDCCESVYIEDISGNVENLLNSPVLLAEEVESNENPPGFENSEFQEYFVWTYYKLATVNGYVTIRWYGESNGYYSVGVSFENAKYV